MDELKSTIKQKENNRAIENKIGKYIFKLITGLSFCFLLEKVFLHAQFVYVHMSNNMLHHELITGLSHQLAGSMRCAIRQFDGNSIRRYCN